MHKTLPKFYYFIDKLNIEEVKNLNKKIAIIYRNYQKEPLIDEIIEFRKYCKKNNHIFIISNYFEIALRYNLDGIYIPAFNKKIIKKKFINKKNFIIIGSAHNIKEIRIKEYQKVQQIFISSIFPIKKSKNHLDITKFNLLSNLTKKPIIALGGINKNNIKKLNMTNAYGFASINYIKNKNRISNLILWIKILKIKSKV